MESGTHVSLVLEEKTSVSLLCLGLQISFLHLQVVARLLSIELMRAKVLSSRIKLPVQSRFTGDQGAADSNGTTIQERKTSDG